MDSTDYNKKKPTHPKQNANIFSKATFCYTLPQFIQGSKRELVESDLYDTLEEHKSKQLGDQFEKLWNEEKEKAAKKNISPSLMTVIVKALGFSFMKLGFIHLLYDVIIKISQSLFLAQLIDYYTPDQTRISETDAYLYATGIVGCSLLVVMMMHPTVLSELNIGMKARIGLCSIIYRKALRLNKTAYQQTTVGQIVNLLSNDVNRFDIVPIFLHYLWIGPLQTLIALYLMYRVVQVSAVYGVIVILLFIPLEMILAKLAAKLRQKTATRTDERVRLMNEIILGIQVIKMYTWEKPFEEFVKAARRTEINAVKSSSYIRGIYTSFILFTSRTALFVTVICYVLPGNRYIDAKQVFLVTALFNVLRHSMTILLPQGLALFAETIVSVRRINQYLLYDEQEYTIFDNEKENNTSSENSVISIKNGSAKWVANLKENVFTDLSLQVPRGNLTAVIGPVGSGKSSLLNVMLQELKLYQGNISVIGKISYASQEPWLFSSNVRQNILFGEEMDLKRYRAVVKCCALETDFQLFPHGDKTIVGERGISLSGGQRARINLARAVYKKSDIYLLDDPLSAVDTHVGKHIFEQCIKLFLCNYTVILITHQLQYLKEVDRIIILENGVLKAEGNYENLTNVGLDFAQLLKNETEANQEEVVAMRKKLSKQDSITSEMSYMDNEGPTKVEEMRSEGTISSVVYKTYINAAGSYFYLFLLILLLIGGQITASLADYFITYWVNLQQDQNTLALDLFNKVRNDNDTDSLQFSSSEWFSFKQVELSIETSVYIYTGLTLFIILLAVTRTLFFFKMCMDASIELHRRMFNSIIFATMRFFNVNTSGRILNRFSKDIGVIDDRLPLTMVDTFQIFLAVLAIVIVVASVNVWLAIPSVIIFILFYFIRQFYLTTSRPIKRLEGVARSPVFGHLSASLEGVTTIRAFGAQSVLENEFDHHQDLHSSAWYSFISTSVAFGYWLDLISVIYIGSVTYAFLLADSSSYGGNVGLAITQALALTGMFQWGMKQSTELENQMTSVERVVEYITSIDPEPPLKSTPDKKPNTTWPDFGKVTFVNVYLTYSPDDPPVLCNLNFSINPLEKVGIVGRTGAGKSSLISALFRLSDIEGQVIIDDIDVGTIGLHDLRSKISIIPQEPVLFSGTLRKNLDPFNCYTDEILWKALEEVELKDAVNQKEEGLSLTMSEEGKNFSLGQRQLVCLARAILQNNKILIMDEATANVDLQTDALIQNTIRRKFAHCTVLTIAHRLNTIIDSDKVLVMNAGNMVEFDHPHILLQDHHGYFYKMVEQTGKSMSRILIKAAEDSYKKLISKMV